jgi:hypothetical protein
MRWQQWTGVSMDMGLVVFGTSTDIAVGSGDRSGADVCIWLQTPFGWKTEFVSGNCVREDIRSSGLVNGRLVMDYAPRCCCGVHSNR